MIYCENAEDFEGIIQEILSKVALKVRIFRLPKLLVHA